jgi:hypothetical protein
MIVVGSHVRKGHYVRGYRRKPPRLTRADLSLLDQLLSTDEGQRYRGANRVRWKIGAMWEEAKERGDPE